ncbi:MAG: alanine racemase [Oscillospiraceae bacterium]|nr:alanine racemase [Oscillospiraceae bacterium]
MQNSLPESFLRRTWAEIHLDRAERNLEILKSRINSECTRPACVIKANAYGHGDTELMKCYSRMGVDFFTVSNINEALRLREGGCKGDILILGWTSASYADILAENDIIQAVLSVEHAKELSECAAEKPVRVHIKLDTGMGRIGLPADDTVRCAKDTALICGMPKLEAEGIFTHFAAADSPDSGSMEYTQLQKKRFYDVVSAVKAMGISFKEVHCLNSAATLLHYDERSTLARLGIILYGLKPDVSLDIPEGIMPVMELKSVVSYIKKLKKGESVSYGRTFTAEKDMIIATVPAGYADGYPRLLSGRNEVLINGKRVKGVGRICMDQMMVDITDVPDVHEGTQVTLFGVDGGEMITPDELAQIYGTIGYEVICGINPRVPRIYVKNGEITEVHEYI